MKRFALRPCIHRSGARTGIFTSPAIVMALIDWPHAKVGNEPNDQKPAHTAR
jgi:hypothetical protein